MWRYADELHRPMSRRRGPRVHPRLRGALHAASWWPTSKACPRKTTPVFAEGLTQLAGQTSSTSRSSSSTNSSRLHRGPPGEPARRHHDGDGDGHVPRRLDADGATTSPCSRPTCSPAGRRRRCDCCRSRCACSRERPDTAGVVARRPRSASRTSSRRRCASRARCGPSSAWRRCTTEVAGVEVPAGSSMLLLPGAANRDPRKFANADDVRPDARQRQAARRLRARHPSLRRRPPGARRGARHDQPAVRPHRDDHDRRGRTRPGRRPSLRVPADVFPPRPVEASTSSSHDRLGRRSRLRDRGLGWRRHGGRARRRTTRGLERVGAREAGADRWLDVHVGRHLLDPEQPADEGRRRRRLLRGRDGALRGSGRRRRPVLVATSGATPS